MQAIIVQELSKCQIIPNTFVYVTYKGNEYDMFITNIKKNVINFLSGNDLKLDKGEQFYIGKENDKKLKLEVIKVR